MLNEMFAKTQKDIDPVRFVIATTKEKPWDDIIDYPSNLSTVYNQKLKKLKDPEKATARVVRRVRGQF